MVWYIWKDFLSHSFASEYRLLDPDTAGSNFKGGSKAAGLADRAERLSQRYQGRDKPGRVCREMGRTATEIEYYSQTEVLTETRVRKRKPLT